MQPSLTTWPAALNPAQAMLLVSTRELVSHPLWVGGHGYEDHLIAQVARRGERPWYKFDGQAWRKLRPS